MGHQADNLNPGKITPDIIRWNMMLSSLHIFAYELLRLSIVGGVKHLFVPQGEYSSEQIEEMKALDLRMAYLSEQTGQDLGRSGLEPYLHQLEEFANAVGENFDTGDNNLLLPCARWLLAEGVLTEADIADIDRIRGQRNDMTPEMPKFLFQLGHEVDADLFIRIAEILRKVDLFWFRTDLQFDPDTGEEIDTSRVPDEEIFSERETLLTYASRAVMEFADRFSSDQD